MLALALSGQAAFGQSANDIEALRKELSELRERARSIEEKLNRIEAPPSANQPAVTAAPPPAEEKWSPERPMTLFQRGNSYLDLSIDGLFAVGGSTADDLEALNPGAHDPSQRGFTLQSLETTFRGAVDPYFRGQANLLFLLDSEGESGFELEEAWLETTSLPANLTLRAGQILTEFGRHNPTHPHTWQFVDMPLVNARFLGGDGLRNLGARLSWLAPTPFYSELSLSAQNSHGETAHSFRNSHEDEAYLGRLHADPGFDGAGDLLFTPRYSAAFDLTPSQTLVLGTSAAFGPNASGPDADTQVYGVDMFWKWKPTTHSGGFPFVAWQTEAMVRRYEAAEFDADIDGDGANDPAPAEKLDDYGFYTQVTYGFRKGWVAGLRGDYVNRFEQAAYEAIYGDDPDRGERWRLSPNLTWYPSEFSKIRLQYNLDDRKGIGIDHSVWLQFEFLLGAHGAHKF